MKNIVVVSILFIFINLIPVYSCENNKSLNVIDDAKIIGYSDNPPYFSGMISCWLEISVELPNYKQEKIYKLYLSNEEELPTIGSRYKIIYHLKDIKGYIGSSQKSILNAKIMNNFIKLDD